MKGQVAFEAIGGLSDGLILETAEALGFWEDASPAAVPLPRRRQPSALARFFSTGWGVALLCAVVSLTVLGGVIWAGQRPIVGGPGGSEVETPNETETEPYIGTEQTDVWIKCSGETIYPRKFFVWSGPADGVGFYDTVQSGASPVLPVAVYSRTPYDSTAEFFLPDGYEIKDITLYDGSMADITDEKMNLLFLPDFSGYLSALLPGDYYLCLYVERVIDGRETVGTDYAVQLRIQNSPSDILPGLEENDYQRAWVALRDQLQREGEPYRSMKSHSGLSLPDYQTVITEHHESRTGDYTVMLGVDALGNVVMAFDHYQALTVLRLTTDGSMQINAKSSGNYHCAETVTPPARIASDFRFTAKNEWYSSIASHDAPLYYLLTGMAYFDSMMEELDEDLSLEALGYTYAKKNG